ncbi:MAG: GWxTD domain-containing protein [candidate division Zixibacteria bacterium]|nr:GWxTD domain-containing protein [candidate division Zixibacteria bacterium]
MKHFLLSMAFISIVSAAAMAQQPEQVQQPQQAQQVQQPLRVWADGASYAFFQDRTKSYVEVYVALQRKDIQFEDMQGFYEGKVYLYLEVMDESGKMVDSLGKWVPIDVKYLEDAYKEDVRIFEAIPCTLPPAKYKMRLTAIDGISKRTGVSTFELTVKSFVSDNLDISDLEMAYDIVPMKTDTILSALMKGDRRVIPNPCRYISNEDSLLYFYCEVYNLAQREGSSDEFEVKATLLDSYGYELREYPIVRNKKPGTTAVITEALPVKGLPGGSYELNVRVADIATGRKVVSTKKFMLIYAFDQLTPTMTSPDSLSIDDAKLMEQVIRYITSKEEKDTYSQLNLDGKKKWLKAFWDRKNPNAGSKVNTYKNEIFRRFLYANYYYSTSVAKRNDGWSSDRGRIYIQYGPPDQIDQRPSTMAQKPYERWLYYRLPGQSGGNYFIFVDETGYGNYQLRHSTVKGEISNPEFEDLLDEGDK